MCNHSKKKNRSDIGKKNTKKNYSPNSRCRATFQEVQDIYGEENCQYIFKQSIESEYNKMSTAASSKILKTEPTELELQVSQALTDMENNSPDIKAELSVLKVKSVKELEVSGNKKAIVVFVPVPLLSAFHKVQIRLTRELEKKFPDRHVIFLAERRILPKPARNTRQAQKRPRSRTLTAVHEKMLEDLVFPTEITGKRVKYLVGGGKVAKIFLDSKDSSNVDYKLDTFQSIYQKLTGKQVVFEIPQKAI